jgi:hypothetical protein
VQIVYRHVIGLVNGESERSSGGLTCSTVPVALATVENHGKLNEDGLMLAEIRTEDRSLSATEGACYTVCTRFEVAALHQLLRLVRGVRST